MSMTPRPSPLPQGQRPGRLDSLKNPIARPPPKSLQPTVTKCINPDCDSPDKLIIEDSKLICEACGTVAEDRPNLVNDLMFVLEAGRHIRLGTQVGADASHGRLAGGIREQSDSFNNTIQQGRMHIRNITSALHMREALRSAGEQVFRLAAANNFIQGRRLKGVAAVALYIACRSQAKEEPNQFMLIDFADVLEINVFQLGNMYTALLDQLRMNGNGYVIQPINPEHLIDRFAGKLDFGRERMKVQNDAVRIVQRMKRDWMTYGRRPAGICGAALILAARMNNFRRTPREMVYVVKVNEVTILKRLDEFKVTDVAALTVDRFRERIEREESRTSRAHTPDDGNDPPAFYNKDKPKKKRKRKRKEVDFDDDGDDLGDRPNPSRDVTQTPEAALTEQTQTLQKTKMAKRASKKTDRRSMPPPPVPLDPNLPQTSGPSIPTDQGGSNSEDSDLPSTATPSTQVSSPGPRTKRQRGRPKGTSQPLNPDDQRDIATALADPFNMEGENLQTVMEAANIQDTTEDRTPPATAPPGAEPTPQSRIEVPMTQDIGEDEFEDDAEVRNCLLGPEEVELKTRIWTQHNADWIRAQAAKRLKHEMAVANGTFKPRKTRVRRRQRIGDLTQYAAEMGEGWEERLESGQGIADSAEASVKMMLAKRGYSSKMNFDILKDVYTPSVSSSSRRTSIAGAGSPGSGLEPSSPLPTTATSAGETGRSPPGATKPASMESGEAVAQQKEFDGLTSVMEKKMDEKDAEEEVNEEEDDEEEDDEDVTAGRDDDDDDDIYEAAGDISD